MIVGNVYRVRHNLISLAPNREELTEYVVEVNCLEIYYAKSVQDMNDFKDINEYKILMTWMIYFKIGYNK